MTLAEMRTDLYDRLGFGTTPETAIVRRLDRFINESQREIVPMRGLARLRRSVLTFSSIANNPFAVLPQAAVRIAGIQDRTSQKSLTEIFIQDLRHGDPGLTNVTSNPSNYIIINLSAALAVSPSAPSELFIISDDALDVGIAYAEVVIEGGYPMVLSVTMTGTVEASFGRTDIIEVQKLFLSTTAIGTITVTEGSAGDELARIVPGRQSSRYTRIQLYGTPGTPLTYYCDVDLHVEDLTYPGASPYLPEDYQWLLVCGALKKEAIKRKDWEAYREENSRWKSGIAHMQAFCRQTTDDGYGGWGGHVDFNSPSGQIWPRSPG